MSFNYGFGALLVCALISRIVSEKAFKTLDGEQKVEVLDQFSGMRKWNLVPLIIIVLLFALSDQLEGAAAVGVSISAFVGIFIYLLIMHFLVRRKVRELSVPEGYKQRLMQARWISYAGIVLMIVFMVL